MEALEKHHHYKELTANELQQTQICKNDPISGKEKLQGQKQLHNYFVKTPQPTLRTANKNLEDEKSEAGKSTESGVPSSDKSVRIIVAPP